MTVKYIKVHEKEGDILEVNIFIFRIWHFLETISLYASLKFSSILEEKFAFILKLKLKVKEYPLMFGY